METKKTFTSDIEEILFPLRGSGVVMERFDVQMAPLELTTRSIYFLYRVSIKSL